MRPNWQPAARALTRRLRVPIAGCESVTCPPEAHSSLTLPNRSRDRTHTYDRRRFSTRSQTWPLRTQSNRQSARHAHRSPTRPIRERNRARLHGRIVIAPRSLTVNDTTDSRILDRPFTRRCARASPAFRFACSRTIFSPRSIARFGSPAVRIRTAVRNASDT